MEAEGRWTVSPPLCWNHESVVPPPGRGGPGAAGELPSSLCWAPGGSGWKTSQGSFQSSPPWLHRRGSRGLEKQRQSTARSGADTQEREQPRWPNRDSGLSPVQMPGILTELPLSREDSEGLRGSRDHSSVMSSSLPSWRSPCRPPFRLWDTYSARLQRVS